MEHATDLMSKIRSDADLTVCELRLVSAPTTVCGDRLPAVSVEVADTVSARLLAGDLGLIPDPDRGSLTWDGWTRVPRSMPGVVWCTVTVRPTAEFVEALKRVPIQAGPA
ncbi:hypothetical protein GCM10027059_49910 [Myceligenerans halotolerans]